MSVSIFNLLTGSSSPLLASGDVVAFVDVSDSTQSAQGSTVKATLTQFFAAIPVPIVITSASANALAVGLAGATNPAFVVDASTGSQAAGLKVTGAVAAGTVAVAVISSGADANITINAKGTGTIGIGSVSTGRVTITPVTTITGSLTLSAALIYGGVTLANSVTGTGSMVLSASPTLTGTALVAALTASGLITGSAGVTVASGQTLTLTGATVAGTPTWSSSQAITLSTAAQPNITSVGTLTSLTLGGALSGATTGAFSSAVTLTGAAANLVLATAGSGVKIKEGSDATMGTATTSSNTVTVNTTKVTANSRIFLTIHEGAGGLGPSNEAWVSARSAGTSFTITTNVSAIAVSWLILEPS